MKSKSLLWSCLLGRLFRRFLFLRSCLRRFNSLKRKVITTANTTHSDRYVEAFISKCVSKAKNTTYSAAMILAVLIAASYGSFSINSKADSPDSDTVFYRIDTKIRIMENQFWRQSIAFLRQRRAKLKKVKCYVIVDETHDSYTGKLLRKEKRHSNKLTQGERFILKYIHRYKPKEGDTGSFKYLVIAILYGNKRRVLRVRALKRKEQYKDFIVKTLVELKKEVNYECVLFDRGFYDGSFVEKLKKHYIPFILRAKISRTMKKEYGFYKNWKCYPDFDIGTNGKGNLVLGTDHSDGKQMKWAFITNLVFNNWYGVRKIYKKRWNIENIFKATDGIQLRVQTNNPTTRMFCVCLSFLLYNAWQAKHKKRATLLNFIMRILENIMALIVKTAKSVETYRDKLRINLPFWDKIVWTA